MTVTDGDLQFVDTGEQCGKARRICQKDAVPHILAKLLRASHFANGGEANQLRVLTAYPTCKGQTVSVDLRFSPSVRYTRHPMQVVSSAVNMDITDRLLPPLFGVHVFSSSSSYWVVTIGI
jgi:hypothetical protein